MIEINKYEIHAISEDLLSLHNVDQAGDVVKAEVWVELWKLVFHTLNDHDEKFAYVYDKLAELASELERYVTRLERVEDLYDSLNTQWLNLNATWTQLQNSYNIIAGRQEDIDKKYQALNDSFIHYGKTAPDNEHVKLWVLPTNFPLAPRSVNMLRDELLDVIGRDSAASVENITNSFTRNVGAYNNNGIIVSARTGGIYTNKRRVTVDETFSVSGECNKSYPLIVAFSGTTFVECIPNNLTNEATVYTTVEYTVPPGVDYVAFTTAGTSKGAFNISKTHNLFKTVSETVDDATRGTVLAVGDVVRLNKSDFVNGRREYLTGIVDTDYSIITAQSVPIHVGDRLIVMPDTGYDVWCAIHTSDDLVNATNLYNPGFQSEKYVYVSEHDGYLCTTVRRTDLNRITPAEYTCNIVIDSSRVNRVVRDVAEIENDLQNKQPLLIPGVTLKTINGQSLLGEGDLEILNPPIDTLPAAPQAVPMTNPKHKPFTNIINDCQTLSDWTSPSDSVLEVDTANFILGKRSLHCNKQMRCTKHTYDLLNNDIVLKLRINSIAQGASLELRVGSKDGTGLFVYEIARGTTWTVSKDWQEIAIPHTAYRYDNASVDFKNINTIYIMASGGAVDWNLQYIGLRPNRLTKGIVTFTFDDGYKSQYTGIKLLAEKGITGTIFHITPANDNGLSVSELQELVNYYGADIEAHGDPAFITDTVPESERGGFDAAWTEDSLKTYWENMQKFLKENGLSEGKHMAYPNGMYPDEVVQLAKSYFDSCRTITPFIPLETYLPADRFRIRAVSGISAHNVTVAQVKKYIDKANEAGAWLILVFHKIGDGADSMWCSEADLKAIADYAISSGAHIMNYAEVMDSCF